jgi:hypothetical protein
MKGCGMREKMERAAIRHTHTQKPFFLFYVARGRRRRRKKI